MNKRTVNKLLISTLCFVTILVMSATVFATTIGSVNVSPKTSGNEITKVTELGNGIIGIIQVVGILIAVGCLMVLGVKYMMGSAEEKAEYKKTLMPYVIGAVLLFAASALANVIYQWAIAIN